MRNDLNAMPRCPLVSVIIPMYNSARFISQTLESLTYQTMKNFEVIVVDDCSTDTGVEIVESFSKRFGGRLRVVKFSKNSGTPALPRNVGIQFARGKYLAFLDSDYLYTKTALEELTTLAEKYQAEGVHTDEYFAPFNGKIKSADDPAFTDMNELTNPGNLSTEYVSKYHPDKPTFLTEDLGERVKKYLGGGGYFSGRPYLTLWKRDFLIAEQITFPNLRIHEDQIYGLHCLFLAKKILRVPNICYIHRQRTDSITFERLNIDVAIHKSLRMFIDGFNELMKIMSDIKFFGEHPDYRYAVLNWYVQSKFYHLQGIYAQVHPVAFNSLVEKEFHSTDAAFSAYLFNTVNIQHFQIMRLQNELNKFKQR